MADPILVELDAREVRKMGGNAAWVRFLELARAKAAAAGVELLEPSIDDVGIDTSRGVYFCAFKVRP